MKVITEDINFKQSISAHAGRIMNHKPNYGYIRVINKPKRNKPATTLLIGGIKQSLLSL